MKNTLLGTAVAAVVLFSQPVAALALVGGPVLSVQPFEASITAGSQFTVAVYLDTKGYSVTSAQLNLTFPASRLQALAVQSSSFLPVITTAGTSGTGTASITVGSGSLPKMGTGTVALITFRALTAGPAQITFASTTQVLADGQTGNIVDTLPVTTITIGAASGALTPTPTPIIGGAGAVETGPVETGLMALIVSAIAVLAYAGYASTEGFRRREAETIAASERTHPPDLNR